MGTETKAAWGRKQKQAQKQFRVGLIAKMLREGQRINQTELAQEWGVSQGTVSKYCRDVMEHSRAKAAEDIQVVKGRLLLQHEALLARWLPAAVKAYVDDDGKEQFVVTRENSTAAKIALKALAQITTIVGLDQPGKGGTDDVLALFRRIAGEVQAIKEEKNITPEIEPPKKKKDDE